MSDMPEATVRLTVSEYASLLERKAYAQALDAGGVDNWEWHNDSLRDARYYVALKNNTFRQRAEAKASEQLPVGVQIGNHNVQNNSF